MIRANVNPEMLVWAREESGYSLDIIAHKMKVSSERLLSWESGQQKPTIKQFRTLAEIYKRPSALFFASQKPEEYPLLPDYRLLPGTDLKNTPELLWEIRRAYERREVALELSKRLEMDISDIPLKCSVSDKPAEIANSIRELLNITLEEQFSWNNEYNALKTWISSIEDMGVLVFQLRGIELHHMRGLSIALQPLPVICLNVKDSPRGRIFTLLHELTHIIMGNGGLCNTFNDSAKNKVEIFCNQVAAETLVPSKSLLNEKVVKNNLNFEWDEWQLKRIANKFKVSTEVILRRLLTLKKTTREFYKDFRKELMQKESNENRGGHVPYHRVILNNNGRYYTNLVISAYYDDIITSVDMSNFLGRIKLKHLPNIEKELY